MRRECNHIGSSSTFFFIAKFKVTVETKLASFVSDVKHFCHGIKLMKGRIHCSLIFLGLLYLIIFKNLMVNAQF